MLPERLVECVPNFSEGRDAVVIRDIAAAMQAVPGVYLLDEEQDQDHHRSVLTLVGDPSAMLDAVVRAARVAAQRIDLRRHQGVHPRIGALDVLPFVPVRGVTLAECAELAREAARRLWENCQIPCYLYEAAATLPERRNLEAIRKIQFEELRNRAASDPALQPDVGGPELHPTAGATMVGARKFLIAWNVWLRTGDLTVAQRIAKLIRQSSGGFPFVKALGLPLPRRSLTQVSMNLTDFEETPPQPVFDAIVAEAARQNVEVIGTELIGLVPRRALEVNFRESLRIMNFRTAAILENRLESLVAEPPSSGGLGGRPSEPATAGGEEGGHGLAGFETALRAVRYLEEAVQIAANRMPVAEHGNAFPWGSELLECQALRQRMEQAAQAAQGSLEAYPLPSQPFVTAILRLMEKTVSLQTRVAAERSRLRGEGAESAELALAGAIRHLLGAALHLALVSHDALAASLPSSEAQLLREQTRALRELIRQSA